MQSQAKEFLGFFCTELTFYALYYLMANAILFPEKYISRSIKLKIFSFLYFRTKNTFSTSSIIILSLRIQSNLPPLNL